MSIRGKKHPVLANIERIDVFSGHGDRDDLVDFVCSQDKDKIKKIFLVHGEYQTMQNFRNTLAEEGFELTKTIKIANIEKERVKKIYSENPAGLSKDSLGYYDRIAGQRDSLEVYLHPTADSLVTPSDAITKKLFFNYSLSVMYKKGKEDFEVETAG